MIDEKTHKKSPSLNCAKSKLLPILKRNSSSKAEAYEKLGLTASFLHPDLTPSSPYIYVQTMQEMHLKNSHLKKSKPANFEISKNPTRPLELVGKPVVSSLKEIPRVKVTLEPIVIENSYLKNIAKVKSKYFCYMKDQEQVKVVKLKKKNREKKKEREKEVSLNQFGISGWEQD